MKRTLAISLSVFLSFNFILPSYAILEKSPARAKNESLKGQSVLDYINFDRWKSLDDPYLEKYIATAIEKNNDIKTAALKLEQAKINIMSARAGQLPVVTVGASPILNKMPGSTVSEGTFALPVMAQYELDLFGKNFDKTKAAKKLSESSIYDAKSTDIAVVSMIAATYYNIVKLDKLIELQKELTKDRGRIYELMKISNNEGIISTQDLIAAEKAYILAQNDLLDFQKSRQNALNALAVLIGDSADNTSEYKRISIDKIKAFSVPDEISSDVIFNRPDYKAAEKRLEAAGVNVRVAKKEFLPTINILGLMTFVASSTMGGMDWKNAFALLGANADFPVFTGFAKTANFKLNKNRYLQAAEQYQKTGLISIQEVNDSLYNLKADKEKHLNNEKALAIQKADFKFTQSKYKQGIISELDLLQRQESLIYTEILAAQSKMNCYIDTISLYKSTGGAV